MTAEQTEKKDSDRFVYSPNTFEPEPAPAGIGWRIAAVLAFIALVGINLVDPLREHASLFAIGGRVLVSLALPLIVVVLSQVVHGSRTEKTRVKIFCVVSIAFAAASLTWLMIPHKYLALPFQIDKSKLTARDFRSRAV